MQRVKLAQTSSSQKLWENVLLGCRTITRGADRFEGRIIVRLAFGRPGENPPNALLARLNRVPVIY